MENGNPHWEPWIGFFLSALADRLAEAFAEWLHLKVRRGLWGYEKNGTPHEALDDSTRL